MNITPEELQDIYDDYERWKAHRPFDVCMESYLKEREQEVKAKLYDEWVAGRSAGNAETPNSEGQATAHRAILAGEPL